MTTHRHVAQDYMFKVGKEFQLDDIDVRQYLILYDRARFGSGHQPKMPNRLSTRGGAGGATASSKEHHQSKLYKFFGSLVFPRLEDEDPKLINAVTFKIFLECLKRILEKIRLGYRARNRVTNEATHRRASSDQVISNKYGGVGSRSNAASIKE
mmetsp:Transcript_32618/g.45477  ORF Transcript_32618/g.45477 Transcript_32618/m.45477 type:complete len:154 (+) Transcript_32618:1032-1493(+)